MPKKAKSKKFKLKTHKATSKRFRLTGSGKLMRSKGGKGHFRRRRSKRAKSMLDSAIVVNGNSYIKRIKRLAPNMK
jgi:large subunit ribosomal protein L35